MERVIRAFGMRLVCVVGLGLIVCGQTALAERLDYAKHPVAVRGAGGLTDSAGAESYPSVFGAWTADKPTAEKPAVVVFDYGTPVKVAALAHYCYMPGSRDQQWPEWLAGPAAFGEVKIYASDDDAKWTEVSHLTNLPAQCPQLLKIENPISARYLKMEIISLLPGAARLQSYEIEAYLDNAPASLVRDNRGKAVRRGFPAKTASAVASNDRNGVIKLSSNSKLIDFTIPFGSKSGVPSGALEVRVNDLPVVWNSGANGEFKGTVGATKVTMSTVYTKAGLKLTFSRDGGVIYPFPKLDIYARPSAKPTEWCVPEYFYSNKTAPEKKDVSSSIIPTCMSIIGNDKNTLAFVPDTDRSWVGVRADAIVATFPFSDESSSVMLLAADKGWFSAFRKTVTDVFDFTEPRQFAPVSEAVVEMTRFLLAPALWSEKYQMLRSFPDTDFFYLFYSVPYAIPALTYWEELSGDKKVSDKVDKILKFTLDRRFASGPMKGAIFSEYADRKLFEDRQIPYGYSPFYDPWWPKYKDQELIGLDQGCSRWVTAHTQGALLWSITHVWRSRGKISPEVLAGAKDLADWMLRFQKEDGSWSYAYNDDGEIVSPMSDSGTIWNIWSLHRFGNLTGEQKYSDAAAKGLAYFKNTFINNHLYRGYWEDIYGGGKTELNSNQGYEASLSTMALTELGETEAAISAAKDGLRFVCTRTIESRNYWTSYGGASEQQGWAPGAYIAPAFGRAAQKAWRASGDDIFRPFAGIGKTIGWWMDSSGGGFWLGEAAGQAPIEQVRNDGGGRSFWASWDSAQKVTFMIPWLVDELNRRSGDKIKIDTESLKGTDDRGAGVVMRLFNGYVSSASGQINWIWLKSTAEDKRGEFQLVLINHAEATDVTVRPACVGGPASVRAFDSKGRPAKVKWSFTGNEVKVHIPEQYTAMLVFEGI